MMLHEFNTLEPIAYMSLWQIEWDKCAGNKLNKVDPVL